MKRDLAALAADEHDLLVVGAGIYGAAVAREAALRGMQVALIERDDFGAGTSWNSLKTIHGGIRYLQKLDLARVLASIAERRRMLRLAPHWVRPLPFVLPTRGFGPRGRAGLAAALAIYAALGLRRNRGVVPERALPPGRLLGVAELRRRFPDLAPENATGAAEWWDAQMTSSERVVLAFVAAAAEAGAHVANHVEAGGWLRAGERVCGVRARDAIGGESFEIRGRQVVNCAGPDAWRLLRRPGGLEMPPPPLSRAANLVLRRALCEDAAVGLHLRDVAGARGEQVLFAAPWRGRTLLGTLHLPLLREDDPPRARITESELRELLAAVNRAHPRVGLRRDDVAGVHVGVQAVAGWDARTGQARHAPDAFLLDHAGDGAPGLLSLVGVKFTEACGAARRLVDRVSVAAGFPAAGEGAEGPLLPGAALQDEDALCAELGRRAPALSEVTRRHLVATYGGRARALAALAALPAPPGRAAPEADAGNPLAAPVGPGTPVIGAEVIHAVREEMALTLRDVVVRRTQLAALAEAGPEAIQRCAELAARELGWSAGRREQEEQAALSALAPGLEPPR